MAELPDDTELLIEARRETLALLEEHDSLDDPALGPLLDAARARFGDEREKESRPKCAWLPAS